MGHKPWKNSPTSCANFSSAETFSAFRDRKQRLKVNFNQRIFSQKIVNRYSSDTIFFYRHFLPVPLTAKRTREIYMQSDVAQISHIIMLNETRQLVCAMNSPRNTNVQ